MRGEIIFCTYLCHPGQLCVNENSGIVIWAALAKWIMSIPHRLTYRFAIWPETIGAVAYLASAEQIGRIDTPWCSAKIGNGYYGMLGYLQRNLKAGWVMTCLAGPGDFYLQQGRNPGYAERVSSHVLLNLGHQYFTQGWSQRRSDERQLCAPGVDLPVCTVMKSAPDSAGYRDVYHTDGDNLEFVQPVELEQSLNVYKHIVKALEADRTYRAMQLCEPQMSKLDATKFNLYPNLSIKGSSAPAKLYMDILAECDGHTGLLDIADRIQEPIWGLESAVETLKACGLIEEVA